jgi:hypothetical protein
VVASANASFDFMVFDFIDGEMSVARGKLGSERKREFEKKGKSGGWRLKTATTFTREISCLRADFSLSAVS